jgi:2-keto-4-pentenoate hydratase/2-oxohepta-3-ene-1,7-dioic acid hydratase in catechol pathway
MSSHGSGLMLLNRADGAGEAVAGILVDESVVDLADLPSIRARNLGTLTTLDVLSDWAVLYPMLLSDADGIRSGETPVSARPLQEATLLAPVLYPGAVFCAGANYRDHVDEMTRALNLPPEPDPRTLGLLSWHCMKVARSCVVGPDSTVRLPPYSRKVDWEAEIAVVIGRKARNVAVDEAFDYVAGFTIVNDLSARDTARRSGLSTTSPFYFDWLGQKCFDGSLPMGPWICPVAQIANRDDIGIKLWVNDELMQDSSSKHLIYSMQEQVAHLSARLTLHPGDVIATGTPAGVGTARGRFLAPGDTTRVAVEGIGQLATRFSS